MEKDTIGMLVAGDKFRCDTVKGLFVKIDAGNVDAAWNAVRWGDGRRFKFDPLERVKFILWMGRMEEESD